MLAQLLEDAKAGKFRVVLCWKLNLFGRSVKDVIHNIEVLHNAGVRFICTSHPMVDTDQRTRSGKMLMALLRVLAELDRDLLVERIQVGVARARKEQAKAARFGDMRRTRSGKNLSHGAPRKIWRRGRAAELHAQGMGIRKIARSWARRMARCGAH